MKKVKENKKFVIKNRTNFIIFLVIIALVIAIPLMINSGNDIDYSKYKSSKNSEQLKITYEMEGKKEEFLNIASEIQNAVSIELLNSNVVDEKTLNVKIESINKELKKDTWKTLNMDKPAEWVGSWSVGKDGSVKFKFITDKAEPSWVQDEDAIAYVKLN